MPARRGYSDGPLGQLLVKDIQIIEVVHAVVCYRRHALDLLADTPQVLQATLELRQAREPQDLDVLEGADRRVRGDHKGKPQLISQVGVGHLSPRAVDLASQAKLTNEKRLIGNLGADLSRRNENRHRDRQVEPRPGLLKVAGSQVHRDMHARDLEAALAHGTAHARRRLKHGIAERTDHLDVGKTARDAHLDADRQSLDPVEAGRHDASAAIFGGHQASHSKADSKWRSR